MDVRQQQEAQTLAEALRTGQERTAADILRGAVLTEPHAWQIIKEANMMAGPARRDSVAIAERSGDVVLVPSTQERQSVAVGRLTQEQMRLKQDDALNRGQLSGQPPEAAPRYGQLPPGQGNGERQWGPGRERATVQPGMVYGSPSPVGDRFSQESNALGQALRTGDSRQVQAVMRNVLAEPNAYAIISQSNKLAGASAAENIGLKGNQVVLITNSDHQQYGLGSLRPEQMQARTVAAPLGRVYDSPAPVGDRFSQESNALGQALRLGDSRQVQAVMRNVLAEPNAYAIITQSNKLAGANAAENIGLKGNQVVLITNSDQKQYGLGTLRPEQMQARTVAAPLGRVYDSPASVGDRFSQESNALGQALRSGDSRQVQAVMRNVLAEPNAYAIISQSNKLAGASAPENIGLKGNQVVLITNSDQKQYGLGTLRPEQMQARTVAAPLGRVYDSPAPVGDRFSQESTALGQALRSGDSRQAQAVMKSVLAEPNAFAIITQANRFAGGASAPENIGLRDNRVLLVTNNDHKEYYLGSLRPEQMQARRLATPPAAVETLPAQIAAPPAAVEPLPAPVVAAPSPVADRFTREATDLGAALQSGNSDQAVALMKNVLLEPDALAIIRRANTLAGGTDAPENIGYIGDQVVLVTNSDHQQYPLGSLTQDQLQERPAAATAPITADALPAPVVERFTQESTDLATALQSGNSDQVLAVMKNVLLEPNALAIIKHANTLAGNDAAENIGLNDSQVVLVTNNDHKQYALGNLTPEQLQGQAAVAAPIEPVAPPAVEQALPPAVAPAPVLERSAPNPGSFIRSSYDYGAAPAPMIAPVIALPFGGRPHYGWRYHHGYGPRFGPVMGPGFAVGGLLNLIAGAAVASQRGY